MSRHGDGRLCFGNDWCLTDDFSVSQSSWRSDVNTEVDVGKAGWRASMATWLTGTLMRGQNHNSLRTLEFVLGTRSNVPSADGLSVRSMESMFYCSEPEPYCNVISLYCRLSVFDRPSTVLLPSAMTHSNRLKERSRRKQRFESWDKDGLMSVWQRQRCNLPLRLKR